MTETRARTTDLIAGLLKEGGAPELMARLAPNHAPQPPRIDRLAGEGMDKVGSRWALLSAGPMVREEVADAPSVARAETYARNIENYVGTVKVPVGVAGPLRVNGLSAKGDYHVPLATTEAALVASYSRGAALLTAAGGASAAVLNERVLRTPVFAFRTLAEAGAFTAWVMAEHERIKTEAEATTRHGKLIDVAVHIEGNHVYLGFAYTTGDASGQNMVTIATEAACRFIEAECPIRAKFRFLDGNMSGDKKASALAFLGARGKKVAAETLLPRELVQKALHTTPGRMVEFWRASALGGVMSGTMGIQGHFANGLTALYLATGQDAACVAESATGVTRLEETAEGALYAAVTLPNVMVGTVGGGTGLPSQRACLEILGLAGPGCAKALAEVAAALCLAGELSIIGAFAAGHFSRAHQAFARGRQG